MIRTMARTTITMTMTTITNKTLFVVIVIVVIVIVIVIVVTVAFVVIVDSVFDNGVKMFVLTVITTIKKGCLFLFCCCFNGCLLLFPF